MTGSGEKRVEKASNDARGKELLDELMDFLFLISSLSSATNFVVLKCSLLYRVCQRYNARSYLLFNGFVVVE